MRIRYIGRRPTFASAEHGRLLPLSALGGAILLIWDDVAARTLIAPEGLPAGVVTALRGGSFFIVLMRFGGRSR